jgi:hypothetical protein
MGWGRGVEPVTGPAWLIWPVVGRVIGDRDGDIDRTRLAAQAQLVAASERRLAEAAMDLSCRPGQDPAVGRKRLGQVLDGDHLRRVGEAGLLVRLDTALVGGWAW